jgi:hypothetical protein
MRMRKSASAAMAAAFGPRNQWRSFLRRRLIRQIRRVEGRLGTGGADYLRFVPEVNGRASMADLSARVNWYLPQHARCVPIFVEGSASGAFDASDAKHMDPALIRDAGWAAGNPSGKPHIVVHRLTWSSGLTYLRNFRRATLVDPDFAYGSEEGFFTLHRRFCATRVPTAELSMDRLLQWRVTGGSALVLATGPSASMIDPTTVSHDLRIICNSAVRDRDLLQALRPTMIVFSDPVFHFGPSRYAATFRRDLMAAMELTDALFVTSHLFAEPLVANVPQLAERLAVLPVDASVGWRWPDREQPVVRLTGNVLTLLMLPIAFALAETIELAGCDGRTPDENYFWRHNTDTQYEDDLMASAFQTHQAFFRDRNYADYYDLHCNQLEEFAAVAEKAGKRVTSLTPSHIPALKKRGAPAW